ncbi:MAG: YifB family Mg chelatase-like AAA ATPase [Pseudomonadota bacterium]|nr:YifB family Mg chelatase-like AAA ATPase [Pseudomonadota bacterium]
MEPLRLASLWSRALAGAKAIPVAVEVHLGNGLPQFQIVGLPDVEVRESRERVRVALQACGFEFPQRRITVNLAPADLPKESGRFDLPIALGILLAGAQLPPVAHWPEGGAEVVGELGLDGSLRPVRGALAMAWHAHADTRSLILPAASAAEVALFPQLRVRVAETLAEVCAWLRGGAPLRSAQAWHAAHAGPEAAEAAALLPCANLDLADVRGQEAAREALTVAAAGGHSLLFHGPPGCGKTLLAERLPGLLPPLEECEVVSHAINRSLAGLPLRAGELRQRPCRRPHHSTPAYALTGGGRPLRPGEMSLAHGGVLLLDEIPEFSRACIESLREPLESGLINIARVGGEAVFPADFQLVCTMNPCPCGNPADGSPGCRCSPLQVMQYRSRLSLPVLDRIDLWVPVLPESASVLDGPPGDSSSTVRARVAQAYGIQLARQGCVNARLRIGDTLVHAGLRCAEQRIWHKIASRHRLSARGAHRLLRVARTLADLEQQPRVREKDLLQAAAWRTAF